MILLHEAAKIIFLIFVSIHVGYSVNIPAITYLGILVSIFFSISGYRLKKPSLGLVFILIVTGGIIGNLLLDDLAPAGSWVEQLKVLAGFIIALFFSFIWVYGSRSVCRPSPFHPDIQRLFLLGTALLLLTPAPGRYTFFSQTYKGFYILQSGGLLLCVVILISCADSKIFLKRLVLIFCIILTMPITNYVLNMSVKPIKSILKLMLPVYKGEASIGFAPSQRLRPYELLRPSMRPVFRISSDYLDIPFLVGARFDFLDSKSMTWVIKGEIMEEVTEQEENRIKKRKATYYIKNHHRPNKKKDVLYRMNITSLRYDNYLFLPPNATRITGPINDMEWDRTGILKAFFKRNEKKILDVFSEEEPAPLPESKRYLILPEFWDSMLNKKSIAMRGIRREDTVSNIKDYFKGRRYSLHISFDKDHPFHDFFLNEKPGFCFWFATAAVLALRANNIPARLVSGYAIHEMIKDRLWIVRDRDAHAWVEWQDKIGFWNTMDPTPSSIVNYFNRYQSDRLSRWYHMLSAEWNYTLQKILGDRQNELILICISLIILSWLFVREYRRIEIDSSYKNLAGKEWNRVWLKFLSVTGMPNNPSWTVATYRKNLQAALSEKKRGLINRFFDIYEDSRFAKDGSPPHENIYAIIKRIKKTK